MTSFTKLPSDEAAVLAAPVSVPCAPAAAPWILAATILASSMAFIDGTVANIALPALQREFDATVFDAQWVIESFALFLSALLLVGGAAGDRFGRRRVFAIGVSLFTAASVWCGLASSVHQLIVARSVQGVGGALLVPAGIELPIDIEPWARDSLQQAIGESFVHGFRVVMTLGALLAFASAGLALRAYPAPPINAADSER